MRSSVGSNGWGFQSYPSFPRIQNLPAILQGILLKTRAGIVDKDMQKNTVLRQSSPLHHGRSTMPPKTLCQLFQLYLSAVPTLKRLRYDMYKFRYVLLISFIAFVNAECLPNEFIIDKVSTFAESKGVKIPKSSVLRVTQKVAEEQPCITHRRLERFLETLWRMRMQAPQNSYGFNKLSFCCDCGFHYCCSFGNIAGKACFAGTACPGKRPCM